MRTLEGSIKEVGGSDVIEFNPLDFGTDEHWRRALALYREQPRANATLEMVRDAIADDLLKKLDDHKEQSINSK